MLVRIARNPAKWRSRAVAAIEGGTPVMSTVKQLAFARYCPMPMPSTDIDVMRREGGTLIMQSRIKLKVSGTICSYLPHWAREAPDRMFLAQRTGDNV
jgi:hypothetical protein